MRQPATRSQRPSARSAGAAVRRAQRRQRRLLLLLLAAAATPLVPLVLAATGGGARPPEGVLRVGLRLSEPGFRSGRVAGGRVAGARGLEVDLARELARRLGARIAFLPIDGTSSGNWDIAFSRPAGTSPRVVALPYLSVPEAVLLGRRVTVPVRTLADLRLLRLCTLRGSAGARAASSLRPLEPPVRAGSPGQLGGLLLGPRCDAALADAASLAALRRLAPHAYGALAARVPAPPARRSLALRVDSPLAPRIGRALRSLLANGSVARLERRWLGSALEHLPPLAPTSRRIRVTVIGDSVPAALDYVAPARSLLARGLDLRLDLDACRRLAAPSCGNPPPPTALEAIAAAGSSLGQVAVMDVGYNDYPSTYPGQLDEAMRAMLAQGVRRVIWVTLRERYSDYRSINEEIRAAADRWPELRVADWNAYAAGKAWFAADGIHLNVAGALGIAKLLRPLLAPLAKP